MKCPIAVRMKFKCNPPMQPIPYIGPLRRKIDRQPEFIDGEDWHSIIKRECEQIICLDDIE